MKKLGILGEGGWGHIGATPLDLILIGISSPNSCSLAALSHTWLHLPQHGRYDGVMYIAVGVG